MDILGSYLLGRYWCPNNRVTTPQGACFWVILPNRWVDSALTARVSQVPTLACTGFKNGTEGSIQIAVDAMNAASHPHTFLGVTEHGASSGYSSFQPDNQSITQVWLPSSAHLVTQAVM